MDESKDKELEPIVTVKTVVTTKTVEVSEERVGVLERVVAAEEDGGVEDCEGGDVMFEVLGSEVVFDGVDRIREEVGIDNLGRQDGEFGVIKDGGDGSEGVDEFSGGQDGMSVTREDVSAFCEEGNVMDEMRKQCVGGSMGGQDGMSATREDDSALCEEGNVTNEMRNQCVGGNGSSVACDIDEEKPIEVVAEEGIERKSGDVGGVDDVELLANVIELRGDLSSHTVDSKCNDIGDGVLHSTSSITSTYDGKMFVNEEQSFETLKEDDKAVNSGSIVLDTKPREQDSPYEDGEQVVTEVADHCRGTLLEAETENEGQEKPLILDSVSGDPENANSKLSDLHAQTCTIEAMDVVNESIPVPEPDKQINGKMIKETLQCVIDEKSNDAAVTSSVGHGNGALDEIKLDTTDMEIDAPSGSQIHSGNKLVDMQDRGEYIENNVNVAPLSKVSEEETLVVGMEIDAAANFVSEWIACEPPHDYLKSNSENEVSETDIIAKCNTETSLAGNRIKSSDPIASGTNDRQDMGIEGKTLNIVENLGTGSPIMDAEIPHISVSENLATDLHDGSREDGESPSEGVADQSPVTDDSDVVEGVNQEPKCESDTSHTMYFSNQTTDGVGEIGLNIENLQEVPEAMRTEQVSVNNASPNEDDKAILLKPLSMDADGGSLVGPTAKVVPEDPDDHVNLLNASTNDDKIVELSDNEITAMNVTEIGSNMEAAREMQEVVLTDQIVSVDNSAVKDETAKLSDCVASTADVFTQTNSNVEEKEEVQEKAANAERVVYLDNAAPDDKENPKELDPVPSAVVDTQDETCIAYENIHAGPFIVETESPGESTVGSGYVDVDSAPTHDENGRSDGHAVHLPVIELEQEAADDVNEADLDMEDVQDEKEEADNAEQVEEQGTDEDHHVSGSTKPRNEEETNFNPYPIAESLLKDHHISYQLPLETREGFSVSDLVWGKVKSHPWWPGQIFHPSDSSEKAMKYFRKDCYLVAYFGDRTFAWNEASVLKPFVNHFSVAEKQHKTESFQNAVSCVLVEVSRRTELGLACSCVSEEAYAKIRYQMVENAGIREESSIREGEDRRSGLDYFQPDQLIEYIRSLAVFPTSSVDRLELVIAKAQLSAFVRLKGIDSLADFQYYEGIFGQVEHEDSAARIDSKSTLKGPKRKHNLKDIVYKRRREKSMSELMGETMYYLDGEFDSHEEDDNMLSPTSGGKRKASGFDNFTKTISVAKVSGSSNPQQSFKVGDCIRRVANQLTGSSSILKGSSDGGNGEHLEDDADEVLEYSNDEMSPSPSKQASLDEMLSRLQLSAQDPMKGYSFLGDIITFFTEFRNLAVSTQRQRMRKAPSRKRKASVPVGGTPETFEFDDRNDSYWKDMVVQNNAEAKPARHSRKRKDEQVTSVDSEKPSQSKPRKSSRKQYFHGPLGSTAETPLADAGQKNMPAELMLNFSEMGSIPSEINLNKMFRCFGPLKESETEIDAQSSRARLVFKKRSDAEVAYSSAAMFNIFGSLVVNYQLNYTPSASFKSPPLALLEGQEKAT